MWVSKDSKKKILETNLGGSGESISSSVFVPILRRPAPAPAFVPATFEATSFVRESFQTTPFEGQAFQRQQFVEKQFQSATLKVDVQKGHKPIFRPQKFQATGIDSNGKTYQHSTEGQDNAVNEVRNQFAQHEKVRLQTHQAEQQQQRQIHNTAQNALEIQHHENQVQLETQHHENQQTLHTEHGQHQDTLQRQHEKTQDTLKAQHGKEQQELQRQHNENVVVDAVANAAATAAVSAMTNSLVANTMAYRRGEKDGIQAATQVVEDTVVGGVLGGVVGGTSLAVGGGVISVGFLAAETCTAIRKYMKDECSGRECAEAVAKTFAVRGGGMLGAVAAAGGVAFGLSFMTPVGPLLWALPIIGSALGYSGGASAADYLFTCAANKIYEWLKDRKKLQVLKEAYDFLEVNSDDLNSVISRHFRTLAMKHHPDKGGDMEEMTKLLFYMEIIRCYRENKQHFEEQVLLLGYA